MGKIRGEEKTKDPKLPANFEEWVNLFPERLMVTPDGDAFLYSYGKPTDCNQPKT